GLAGSRAPIRPPARPHRPRRGSQPQRGGRRRPAHLAATVAARPPDPRARTAAVPAGRPPLPRGVAGGAPVRRLPSGLAPTARREGLRVALGRKRYVLYADPTGAHGEGQRAAVHDTYPVDGDYEPAVEQALARLPRRYQTLIRLRMWDSSRSYPEAAKTLALPIGSIGPMR